MTKPAKRTYLAERVGDMEFYYTPDQGVSLTVHGVPVIRGTSLWVVAPHFARRFYGPIDNPYLLQKATVEPWQGGRKITLYHKVLPSMNEGEGCPFSGTETFIITPDNTYSATLSFNFSKDVPAWIEWGVGCFNPSFIIGCPFAARVGDESFIRGSPFSARVGVETLQGVIPIMAKSASVRESTVAEDFSLLTMETRLGDVRIETYPEDHLIFFDYRKNVWADVNKPMFWMGVMDKPIEPKKPATFSVTMRFPATMKSAVASAGRLSNATPLQFSDAVRIPHWGEDYIIPRPKKARFTDASLPLTSATSVYIGKNPTAGMEKALAFLLRDLKELYNIEPRVMREDLSPDEARGGVIVLGEEGRHPAPAVICGRAGLEVPTHPEGYSLLVTPDAACIAAKTERGVFYGVTTLVQLIRVSDKGVFLHGAEIVDYPALNFRGIHCLTGKNAGGEIAKAVRELMARFKINTLVLECEYITWDSHPELAQHSYGMSKDDARKVIRAADENMIEVIPLIQSLGHSEWMFTNGQHLDLAEDPERPYHSCPTNPQAYKLIFDVYQEAVDLFKPRIFHIGHDEVTGSGRFPYRSKKSGKTVTQLIMEDIQKLHTWFKERNIQVMLWGDMFLYKTEAADACNAGTLAEAKERRSLLPRDVIIADWHYEPVSPEKYTSLKIWKDEGLAVVGAGWDNSTDIRNLAKAAEMNGALGYLQTTWAGFNFAITNNEPVWRQYWSYILAAHYAWSGDATPEENLPFRAHQKLTDLWFDVRPDMRKRSGFFVDLRPFANRRLDDTPARNGWVGFGPDLDFSSIPCGESLFDDIRFNIQKNEKGCAAVLLAGRLNPPGDFPSAIEISHDLVTVTELHFLMNSAMRAADNTPSGAIVIAYEDGTADRHNLAYGKTIFASDDYRLGRNARIVWQGQTHGGENIRLWDISWKNPKPDLKVCKITVESAGTEAAPVLLAITGVR